MESRTEPRTPRERLERVLYEVHKACRIDRQTAGHRMGGLSTYEITRIARAVANETLTLMDERAGGLTFVHAEIELLREELNRT